MSGISPFQTIGPYFGVLLQTRAELRMVGPDTRGERITIRGVLYDGAGSPIRDALIEIWQADAEGRYAHPDDPRNGDADRSFHGYGWRHTAEDGGFTFDTIKPGVVPGPDGRPQAPHILVSVTARGVLTRYITRIYFDGDPRNADDAILQLVPATRRVTLMATPEGANVYRFDIRFQGTDETVFFDA